MDPTLKGMLLGSAGPCSRDSLAQLSALEPVWLEADLVLAPDARVHGRSAPDTIEALHDNAHGPHQFYRYAPGDPATDDAIVVAWLVSMTRSADSILLAEGGRPRSAGLECALRRLMRAVGNSYGDAAPEPLVVALLEAAHAAYGRPLQLWAERCPQTGGPAIVIAPQRRTSGTDTSLNPAAAPGSQPANCAPLETVAGPRDRPAQREGENEKAAAVAGTHPGARRPPRPKGRTRQAKGSGAARHDATASYAATGSKHTMIAFPSHRRAFGSAGPRGSSELCRWTAEQLAKADVLRLESPNGRRVPQQLESRLANAHAVAVSLPGRDAERAAQDLLGDMSVWLGGAPVEVTVTVGTCTDDPGAPVISELVIAKGIANRP